MAAKDLSQISRSMSGGGVAGIAKEISFDVHARRIATKATLRLIEITDVDAMHGPVYGRLRVCASERKCFFAFEDAQILRRNGKNFAEQLLQVVGPEALGAGKKFGRINYVRRAILVDMHGEGGVFPDPTRRWRSVVR